MAKIKAGPLFLIQKKTATWFNRGWQQHSSYGYFARADLFSLTACVCFHKPSSGIQWTSYGAQRFFDQTDAGFWSSPSTPRRLNDVRWERRH